MEKNTHKDTSQLIQAVMPDDSSAELQEAQGNLDRFLDAIDRIHERLRSEAMGTNGRDKLAPDDTVYTVSSQ